MKSDSVGQPDDTGAPIGTSARGRWMSFVAGSVSVIVVLAAAYLFLSNNSTKEPAGADSVNFAKVVIADLVQEETFDGTLGSIDDDPVTTQIGGTITEIAAPGDTVGQGDSLFSIDGEPVVLLFGDLPAFRDIAIGEESVTVSSHLFGAITSVAEPGRVIRQGDVLYSVDGRPVIALYGDVPAFRNIAMREDSAVVSSHLFGTITSVAEPGAVIQQGDVLYSVSGQPVVVLYGNQPAYRDLGIVEEPTIVSSRQQGTITSVAESGTLLRQGDTLFSVNGRPVVVLYGDQPAYRDLAIVEEPTTVSSQLQGTITWVAEPGTVVRQGDVLYRVNGQPVVALYGEQPAYRPLYDTAPDLASAMEVASFAERDLEAALRTLEEPVTPRILSDLESAVDEAENDYHEMVTRWFGPTISEELLSVSPPTILTTWGVTYAEIFDRETAVQDDPQTPWDEFTVFLWVKFSPFEIDTSESPEPSTDDRFAPQRELEDAWSALENARDERDAQGVSVKAAVLDAEKAISDAEDHLASAQSEVASLLDPTTGTDVLQLERALATLGYDADGALVADGVFTAETTRAVLAFQAATGLEQDGIVDHREVVFLPGPTQVLARLASPGDQAGGGVVSLAIGKPTSGADVLQLEEALVTLGYGALVADGVFTAQTTNAVLAFQAAYGLQQDGVVDQGEVVFLPGPTYVLARLASPGDQAGGGVVGLAIGKPTSGPDVLQLEEALVALGYDAGSTLVADGVFTAETTQAVLAFQAATGAEQDGIVDHGEVVFLPGPTQVLARLASPGDQAGGGVVSVATGKPTAGPDVLQLEEALIALGYDADGTLVADGVYTRETTQAVLAFQSVAGLERDGIVDHGEVVFLPGPAQVLARLASPGDQTGGGVVRVATGKPTTGPDVLQLEEALVALGYDAGGALVADGVYTPDTTQAVLAFQAAAGLEQDGIVHQGEVVFLPGAVRVTDQLATSGSGAGPGSAVLGISLSPKLVRIDLPADKQGSLAAGNAVTVVLPDFTEVPATVLSVSKTANQAQFGPATFDVVIELDDSAPATGLDEAPVDVIAVSDSVEDVMAVPVSALLALLEGGYAVETDAGGGLTRLVPVEVAFFGENGMIQIASAVLQPGDRVVVP